MSTTPDFRQIITEALESQGKTKYWLAQQVAGTGPVQDTVYRYLSGKKDMTGENIALLLAALGIEVRPKRRR